MYKHKKIPELLQVREKFFCSILLWEFRELFDKTTSEGHHGSVLMNL
jgi:hypothetical protein